MKRATAARLAAVCGVTAALASLTTAHASGYGMGGSETYQGTGSSATVDAYSYAADWTGTVQIAVIVKDLTSNATVASCTTSGDSGLVTNHCPYAEVAGDWYQVTITSVHNRVAWVISR